MTERDRDAEAGCAMLLLVGIVGVAILVGFIGGFVLAGTVR